jgi:hypothetical protein
MQSSAFEGPLFIVGMPRSGTKLLRDLLLGHPRVALTTIETQMLPYWMSQWTRYGDLEQESRFQLFYKEAIRLPYFMYLADHGKPIIEWRVWHDLCPSFDVAGVFEALVRHDTGALYGSGRIWGDKSPSYLTCTALLRGLYPRARFVHIIRDVRDASLSARSAWGKHVVRYAQQWADRIGQFRQDTAAFSADVLEVRYEDLVDDTEATLISICELLGLEFKEEMLTLRRPVENLGRTKGRAEVVKQNTGMYKNGLNGATVARIEAVAREVLCQYGYPVQEGAPMRRVPKWEMGLHRAQDALQLLGRAVAREGVRGIKRTLMSYRTSAR